MSKDAMRGYFVRRVWQYDPTLYAPPSYRRACSYDAFVPDPLSPPQIALPVEVTGLLSDAERAIAALNQSGGLELAPLARLLLRTESIASSKIEGMQVDARTLARAEARQDAGRSVGAQAAEILANIEAMELAVERASSAAGIRVTDLKDIHRVLMARYPGPGGAGNFRNSQNWIGGNNYNACGADYVPPPPEEIGRLVDDLCSFANEEAFPPLLQAAIAHAQFETIHPFADGNGRTGRALIQVILRRRGLAPAFVPPISVILAKRKERYIGGLVSFREDRILEWVAVFAEAAAEAAQLARRYRGRVAELQDGWRKHLQVHANPRSDAAAWAIIDILPGHPIVSVPLAVAATRRTRPAVTNAVEELQRAGVLLPLGASARNRAWEANGLLDLIVDLESGSA